MDSCAVTRLRWELGEVFARIIPLAKIIHPKPFPEEELPLPTFFCRENRVRARVRVRVGVRV